MSEINWQEEMRGVCWSIQNVQWPLGSRGSIGDHSQIRSIWYPGSFIQHLWIAEEVQETLLGILGFDDMDFVQDLLTHRDEIVHAIVTNSRVKWLTIELWRYPLVWREWNAATQCPTTNRRIIRWSEHHGLNYGSRDSTQETTNLCKSTQRTR